MVDKICFYCGKKFSVPDRRSKSAKYCSKECYDLAQSKRIKVKCDYCGKTITKKLSVAKNRQHHFCNLKCLGLWNGEKRKNKIEKTCVICGKKYEVIPFFKDSVTCSVDCQKEWQKIYRCGKNSPTWKGGGKWKTCILCGKKFYADYYTAHKEGHAKFCSLECKRKYWENNILVSETFKKKRHDANMKMLSMKKTYPAKETSLERNIRTYLEIKNISHDCQHVINNKFCVDFFIEKENIIIEALGDYWHANPLKYNDDNISQFQIRQQKRDKARFAYLKKCGYTLFTIWEHDVNQDIDKAMKPVIDSIGTLETDISASYK